MFILNEFVLLGIILVYTILEIFLYATFYLITEKTNENPTLINLSVIIASKNEAENLKNNLPFILSQNHDNFEVIVIDDQSSDMTFDVIKKFKIKHSNLKYFEVDKQIKSSKKKALSSGIEKAQYEHLIFTDADCKPLSDQWLSEIQNYFMPKDSVILGYSPYRKEKGWLNKLIRFETFQTAINYYSLGKLGKPYMGVGRNLAYTKTIFKNAGGFDSHANVKSGDDDLFINRLSEEYSVNTCLNPKTFVESEPKRTLESWINQKRRHITTAPHYKFKHQLFLGFQFITRFLFWFYALPVSILLLFNTHFYPVTILIVCLIFKLIISKLHFQKLTVKDLWIQSYALEFQLICIQLYIFTLNLVFPKHDW